MLSKRLFGLILILLLSGCAALSVSEYNDRFGKPQMQSRMVHPQSNQGEFYLGEVKPILDNRCVVCHGCYDAPCQLKLSSPQGIDRGISPDKVYDGTRLLAAPTTRLFIDEKNTQGWRNKSFSSVLNERQQSSNNNQQAGLLYQTLALKKQHPLPNQKLLDDSFDLSINRDQSCSSVETYNDYADDNPLAGMPFGLPAIHEAQHNTLKRWVNQGGKMASRLNISTPIKTSVNQWEGYLNRTNNKSRLVSRYIYEHLFLGSLYFSDIKEKNITYFKLVRSTTKAPHPIEVIATRRPFDSPGHDEFYYRLQPIESTILAKTHMPYSLSNQRMQWIDQLFFTPDYSVDYLPGYDPKITSNPFKIFSQLPTNSRYRFMLEEAQYIIMGFIKGTVCRGQVALNVIDDHFWVFFIDPDIQDNTLFNEFLVSQQDNLSLPAEEESNAGVVFDWLRYAKFYSQYTQDKAETLTTYFKDNTNLNLDLIWDGEGNNDNAALTVFRHFDSSTVEKGLVGQAPKTAWVINYPLLERIHYLLVAGFDVYGNLGHQLLTRLYMDFLRMDGENNFLSLLPRAEQKRLQAYWYRDALPEVSQYIYDYRLAFSQEPNIQYRTHNPQQELYDRLRKKLQPVLNHTRNLDSKRIPVAQRFYLESFNKIKGTAANLFPEISTLMLNRNGKDTLYTLIRNNGHSNISSLFLEERNRLPQEDYLTLVPGVLGSYPAAFWKVNSEDLAEFTLMARQLKEEDDYAKLKDRFAVRRTSDQFWAYADKLHQLYKKEEPISGGLLDFNRLENR